MIGTFINVIAVLAGAFLGLLIKERLSKRFITILFQAIGLFTLFLGVSMALQTTHIFLLILSLILGSLVGELLRIDRGIERFASYLKRKTRVSGGRFSEGLITAFLLYCMGSVSILGAIDEGLRGDPNLLLVKSMMDGISSIALASTMGIGVAFSVIPLFLYQGGITLFAGTMGEFFSETVVSELTATGGILLIGLGISILEIKPLKIINMLPALLVIILLVYLFG